MMYYGTDVTRINSALLSLPEENNNNGGEALLMENILGRNEISISKDAFKNVSYRLTNLSNMALSIFGNGGDYLTLQNTNVDVDGYLNIIDILCPKLKEGKIEAQSIDDYEPFTRITSFSKLMHKDINIAFARLVLKDIFSPYKKGLRGEFGLGLSIVKKSVQLLGYDITIRNEKKGVSFIIKPLSKK